MNTFNKKSLYLAVAGISALGAGSAQAVSVNPDGLGQVLLYPYYTVRETSAGSPYNSLLSVVNSTGSVKAVKVRFLEGKNSREVLDFNLYLSPKDVWVAAIIPTADGAGVFTPDKSCTTPRVSQDENNPTPFVNFAYVGTLGQDPAPDDLDRTREGYVEIIEMGNVFQYTYTAYAATHFQGVPPCDHNGGARSIGLSDSRASGNTTVGNGGLFGSMTLINVNKGIDFGYDPTALQGFSDQSLWSAPGTVLPNLAQVSPKTSIVLNGFDAWISAWDPGYPTDNNVDAVSAVLMHDNVYNEFVLDKATASGTDWVITMPTKTYYYTGASGNPDGTDPKEIKVTKLFQRNFKTNGACDDFDNVVYDREERVVKTPSSFSPPPPAGQKAQLCWEANVITFNSTNVLASLNKLTLNTTFENGWVAIGFPVVGTSTVANFTDAHQLGSGNTTRINLGNGSTSSQVASTYYGLPVIGFAAITFSNGNVGGVLSNYGGNFNHKTTRRIN